MASRLAHRADALRYALFAFIVIQISAILAYVGVLAKLRLGLVTWLVALASVFLLPRGVRWPNLPQTGPGRAILGFGVMTVLSVPFALSMGQAGTFVLNVYSRIFAFFVMLVVALRGPGDMRLFTWAYVLSGGLLGVLAFTVMHLAADAAGSLRLEGSHMYDANDLGMVFMTALPLGVLLTLDARGWRRLLALGCIVLMMGAFAKTNSRGGFVGAMVVLPGLFVAMNQVSLPKRLAAALTPAIAIVAFAPPTYWERIATIFAPSKDYNVTESHGRLEIAKRGMGYMLAYPLTGVGVANFGRAEGTISPLAIATGGRVRWIAPHNTFVQVGAELGVVALALWLGVLWQGTWGLWRRRASPRETRHLARDARFVALLHTFLPISFLAFAVTSFFTSHAYTPPFYVLSALLIGTLLFRPRSPRPGRAPQRAERAVVGVHPQPVEHLAGHHGVA